MDACQSLCEGGIASDVETCKKEFAPIESLLNQTFGGRSELLTMALYGWKVQYNPQGSGVTMNHADKVVEIGPSRSPEQNAFEFRVEWDDDLLEDDGPSKLKKMSSGGDSWRRPQGAFPQGLQGP
ncbi:hypothetical protein [Actinomadura sp. HBU206391]|uniref:hypothetical protein n=1 Tax=Actinomadura sp. HBU206391 TaxID=2731692 RepID=UPI001650B25E|nr:hypothetical protein [Actinomadura sp. HBU206391]MBC6457291.1 hypothetical protein [Actinomadura sp. HBU206391]